MGKSVRNYILGSLAAFFIVMFIVVATSDDTEQTANHEAKTVTTTVPRTLPVPQFEENDSTLKIPNPCDTIDLKEVLQIVPSPIIQGPVIQNAVAPSKKCEWTTEGSETPRLGISIILSTTFFDESEATKVSDLTVGDKSFTVEGYVTGFGGTICGKTAIVEKGEFSYAVALCLKDNKNPSDAQLEQLATQVQNTLG